MGKNNAMQRIRNNVKNLPDDCLTSRELKRKRAREEAKNGKGSIRHRNKRT